MNRREFVAATFGAGAAACAGRIPPPAVNLSLLPNPVRMIAGINDGIGGILPPDIAARYASYGGEFIIRTPFRHPMEVLATVLSVYPYPNLKLLWLVENADPVQVTALAEMLADRTALPAVTWGVGIGNETDIDPYNWGADRMAMSVTAGRNILRASGWTGNIVSTPIYSVDDQDHMNRYLRPVLGFIPDDVIIDLHWYGDTSDYWLEQVRKLNRRIIVSEFGMPALNSAQDEAQAAYYREKLTAFTRCGIIEAAIAYQRNGGSTLSNLDNFGLQRFDGTWKPAERVLADYVREQQS